MDNHNIDQGSLKVYGAVIRYKLDNMGVSPSIPELVDMTGYNSTKPVNDRLKDLEDRGLIVRKGGTPRSIQIVGGRWSGPKSTKRDPVTPRAMEVYKAICHYARKHDGNPPTLADLGGILGVSSDSTARYHVQRLINAGYLMDEMSHHRSVRVKGATYELDLDEVPEQGRAVAAGVLAESMAVSS